MQLKTYFFVPFVCPCMHLNYGAISGSHACRDRGWHIILVAELYTTCPGEQVLVATKFNVTSDARLFCKDKQENLKNKPKIGNLSEKQAQYALAIKFNKTKNQQENYIKK